MKHFNITFEPDGREVSIHAGATLLEAAGQAGIILNTVCGGKGICKKCVVNILPDRQEVLACQYRIQEDLVVIVPISSRFFEQKILTEGISPRTEIQPDIYKKYLKFAPAGDVFGVHVDSGTATVVAKLADMTNGLLLSTQAVLNPQTRFGDDVISRINYAKADAELAELHNTIIDCINELIEKICRQASISTNQIYEMCVVGNPTMNHIFLKLPVVQLGQAPYKAFSLEAEDLSPEKIALRINPAGNIHTVENIAGFVGSDTVAVALADDIKGGDIDFDCIGNHPPRSICGSGLIDAVAVLLDLGVIDRTGRFTDPANLPLAIHSRIMQQDGQPAFRLADKVVLTQKDIREVQLAKAAIRAGIRLLQKKLGIKDDDIKQVLLAGAFGNYIRRESALRIGLLPNLPLERIRFIGNAAASGAQSLLVSSQCRSQAG